MNGDLYIGLYDGDAINVPWRLPRLMIQSMYFIHSFHSMGLGNCLALERNISSKNGRTLYGKGRDELVFRGTVRTRLSTWSIHTCTVRDWPWIDELA